MKLFHWCRLLTVLAGLMLGACANSTDDSPGAPGRPGPSDSPLGQLPAGPNGIGTPSDGPNGLGTAGEPEANPTPQPEAQPEANPEPQPEANPEPQPEMQPEANPEPQPEAQPEPQPEGLVHDRSLSVKEACKRGCERLIDCDFLEGRDKKDCEDDCEDAVDEIPEDERTTPNCRLVDCEDAQLCYDTLIDDGMRR